VPAFFYKLQGAEAALLFIKNAVGLHKVVPAILVFFVRSSSGFANRLSPTKKLPK
jgi:hypothetical protein